MKIIISHAYSKENKGDAALLSVLLNDIHRAFDNPQITILTLDDIEKDEVFEGASMKNNFMYHARSHYDNPALQAIYAVFVATSTLAWASVYKYTGKNLPIPRHLREIALLYREADLIIPVGGGYILSKPGFVNTVRLFFVLHPLLLGYILDKPTINYTQSIGFFGNKLQESMAKFALKRVTGIIVRENTSFQLLKSWGISDKVCMSVDGGFSFVSDSNKDLRTELTIPKNQMLVGITVRTWFKPEAQINYEKTIAAFSDYIIKKYNAIVIFIPQVTNETHHDDDRESSQRVYALIEQKENAHLITERYDHHTIKAIYQQLDYLVGTRFHSVIFSLTSYVPSIAIGYEPKTLGIMSQLGLEHWVVDIKKIQADQLMALFDKLVVERDHYINQLKKNLPSYIEQSRNSIFFVKQRYEQYVQAKK